jgi:hypothetical protein
MLKMECVACGESFTDGITAGNHEISTGHRVEWIQGNTMPPPTVAQEAATRVAHKRVEQATDEARHAVQWLENGGPLFYNLSEAEHHLRVALRFIERARALEAEASA